MKVLTIVGGWPAPGRPAQTFVKSQVEALRALGVTCDVMVIRGRKALKYVSAIRTQREMLDTGAYDVVHAHYGYCGWVGRLQRRAPLVVSFLGDDVFGTHDDAGRRRPLSSLIARLNRLFARCVDAVIVKSDLMALRLGVQAHVIPNGVDLVRFARLDRDDACRRLGMEPQRRYILFPADPAIPVKNIALARQSVAEAARMSGDSIELLTVGGVDYERMPLYYSAADVAIFTSRSEGSPNAIKEAMACNLPIVSVPVGDIPHLLRGVDLSVVGPYDSRWLAERLIRVLRSRRRSNGRDVLIERGLDSCSVARRVLAVYSALVAGHPTAKPCAVSQV